MKLSALVGVVCALGCGASKPKPVDEAPPVVETPRAAERAEAPAPSEPAAKNLAAKAALSPVKGAKQPPGVVTFTQSAAGTNVSSDFTGLPRGRYHLVIHENAECGPNATQAGAPWKGAESVKLTFSVGGDEDGNIEESGIGLSLDGVAPIVGQTLVLHDDKKGAPGKAVACGTIDTVGQ